MDNSSGLSCSRLAQTSAVIFAIVKLLVHVVPTKGPAWKGNFPQQNVKLETAGPMAREYADYNQSICYGSLPFWEHQTSPPVLHDIIHTTSRWLLLRFISSFKTFSENHYQWAHVKQNNKVSDQKQVHPKTYDLVQLQRYGAWLGRLRYWQVCQLEKSWCLTLSEREEFFTLRFQAAY